MTQKELAQLVTIPTKSAAILIKNTEMIDECNIQEDIIKKMFEVTENPLLKMYLIVIRMTQIVL